MMLQGKSTVQTNNEWQAFSHFTEWGNLSEVPKEVCTETRNWDPVLQVQVP